MRRNLLLLWILAISLVTLAAGDDLKPCRIQPAGDHLRCVIPVGEAGYSVRIGDCPGNDIPDLYRDHTTLQECARLCSSTPDCQAFMFYNNHRCFPKTKTCGDTWKLNHLNVFYDKVPRGYTMRAGDCPGNDIWYLSRGGTRQECAKLCDSSPECNAFMHYNNRMCHGKTKGCGRPYLFGSSFTIFYDKVPHGYSLRGGDCPGNDIPGIGGPMPLAECANRCNSDSNCISFMYFDGERCYPKTRTCALPSRENPKNVFYDKVPSGYAMRPGDCPGNDIWSIHGFTTLEDCARRCHEDPGCVSFMFYDGRECYPKTKTCQTTDITNPKHFFYDKILTV